MFVARIAMIAMHQFLHQFLPSRHRRRDTQSARMQGVKGGKIRCCSSFFDEHHIKLIKLTSICWNLYINIYQYISIYYKASTRSPKGNHHQFSRRPQDGLGSATSAKNHQNGPSAVFKRTALPYPEFHWFEHCWDVETTPPDNGEVWQYHQTSNLGVWWGWHSHVSYVHISLILPPEPEKNAHIMVAPFSIKTKPFGLPNCWKSREKGEEPCTRVSQS